MTTIPHLPEAERVERLHQLGILDTPHDKLFRGFVEEALVLVPGTSIAAISLVDFGRQWFKSIIGLEVQETLREVSFCSHTIQTDGMMVVEDARTNQRFAKNPLVIFRPSICFYAGVRLIDGVGAPCVIGSQPRKMTKRETSKLAKLAQHVDIQLLAHGTLFNLGTRGTRLRARQHQLILADPVA